MLFIEGTTANLGLVQTELTSFRAAIKTDRSIDLTRAPFDAFTSELIDKSDYGATQSLGAAMRAAGVTAFRYFSARDSRESEGRGVAVGVFHPAAFGRRLPKRLETWHCAATRDVVEFVKRDYFDREAWRFGREQFLVEGTLPSPAV